MCHLDARESHAPLVAEQGLRQDRGSNLAVPESQMRFGLFGGAKSAGGGPTGDSQGYRNFIDYVLLAEELGYDSVFLVEHHFTGVGQVSASLNLLSYLAGRTS